MFQGAEFTVDVDISDAAEGVKGLSDYLHGVTEISGIIKNSATVQDLDGEEYALFNFLDKGVSPHEIGDEETLLGNREKNFGPVWGPVWWEQSLTPLDISSRAVSYFENTLNSMLSQQSRSPVVRLGLYWLMPVIRSVFMKTVEQCMAWTPANWIRVKTGYSYELSAETTRRVARGVGKGGKGRRKGRA